MERKSLTSEFKAAAALLAGGFVMLFSGNQGPSTVLAGQIQQAPATAPRLPAAQPGQTPRIVTWGDSIANGMGMNWRGLNGAFNQVTNLGRDSAGLLNPAIPVKPLDISKIPAGSVVLMNIGTNDVGYLENKSQKQIDRYAQRVVALARQVEDSGSTAIIIGMQAPVKAYGQISGHNFAPWVDTMNRVNTALEAEAGKQGITFSDNKVAERASDGLHYTSDGYRNIVKNALHDAGLTR